MKLLGLFIAQCVCLGALHAQQSPVPMAGVVVEGEDFKPQGDGWKTIFNGQGNYMVDIIGFSHISGERVLSADARAKGARAAATVQIPEAGDYRVWSRFEQPTGTENRFEVVIKQNGKTAGSATMGEKAAPKYWFGDKNPVGQYDASWGSEGLVDQSFDVKGLQAGPAEITLVAVEQPEPAANRNVDFVFLTRDLTNSWYKEGQLYPILNAALACIPTRYYLRLTSPEARDVTINYLLNRMPWYSSEKAVKLEAGKPSEWIPLRNQDVCHFTTFSITSPSKPGLDVRAELASDAGGTRILRTIDWKDPQSNELQIGLPPYPNKYPEERILTVEEQYRGVLDYLKAHPSKVGKDPQVPLGWYHPTIAIWQKGRLTDAAAELYFTIGERIFVGFVQPPRINPQEVSGFRERFQQWKLTPGRTVVLGKYRQLPTPTEIAEAKKAAEEAGVLNLVQRFDYGDEVSFSEWLAPIKPEEMKARFQEWQTRKRGQARFDTPNSEAKTAAANPELFVDSMEFYEDTAVEYTASMAREIPKALGADVLYGANVACHPFYYPEIAKYIKWFRGGAATFGRHSEYFWQVGQPGPLINGFVADYFRAGMRDNPRALFLQYAMPHAPGNSDESFLRTAFTQLAHGARGLDYFGIGLNSTFTENYIDFRHPSRYAAIRDVNRAMALIEDILPESRVEPSEVALILSDSTERWDFAPIALDKANLNCFGPDYRKARLAYHIDRLGIYYALVHGSRSPDFLIEEDVVAGKLKDYQVAYWVGDCADPKLVKPLQAWVEAGGHLVATAGALRMDPYRRPLPQGLELLGLKSATLNEKDRFFRPQIELPRLAPLDSIGEMPVFGAIDQVEAGGNAKVAASFKSGRPAVTERSLGKGTITFIAALPGVTYLWSVYQPPPVPPRGPLSHSPHVNFNAEAGRWIRTPAQKAQSRVDAGDAWIDARLIKAPKGYAIPLANYSADTRKPVTLTIRGIKGIREVVSASQGKLKLEKTGDDAVKVTYSPGVGDILRIERAD